MTSMLSKLKKLPEGLASYDREAIMKKSKIEQDKHDAGIGIETETEIEDDENEINRSGGGGAANHGLVQPKPQTS
jgi:hypothetical protein